MSNYSPDLRIELITTGAQAGTWGTTTNTNLGTIIEDAISGYTTVSVISANQAFTAVDGAADEARNAMIRLTTTTTADFAVYAPPNSKQYIIWNNSGYTATIYNSTVIGNTTAAGTGVAIADGDKVVVFTNGTNFYTVKTNNVTGTVAIANGGTNATTASGARTNLGLGTLATQDASAVSVTGGTVSGTVITQRVVVIADGTTVTMNADTTDIATQANTQAAGTLTMAAPTGTPVNGQKLVFRLQSTNVQTFSWNAVFAGSSDLALPTASSGSSKYDYMGFIYNSTAAKWQMLAKNFGF